MISMVVFVDERNLESLCVYAFLSFIPVTFFRNWQLAVPPFFQYLILKTLHHSLYHEHFGSKRKALLLFYLTILPLAVDFDVEYIQGGGINIALCQYQITSPTFEAYPRLRHCLGAHRLSLHLSFSHTLYLSLTLPSLSLTNTHTTSGTLVKQTR